MERYPNLLPRQEDLSRIDREKLVRSKRTQKRVLEHILWMLDLVGEMGKEKSGKAGRWMGWIFAHLEIMGLITNADSRDMARIDARNSND